MAKKQKGLALVPASARMPAARTQPLQADVPQSIRDAISEFEAQVGGRKALLEALSSADSSEEVQVVLDAIADPKHDLEPLAKLCARAGVSPGQLFGAFKTAALVRGQILGSIKAANLVPVTVDEIGRTALPHETTCDACNGSGIFEDTDLKGKPTSRTCTKCNGVGSLHRDGDPEQQRTILELAGLITKGSGISITNSNQTVVPTSVIAGGSLEQLQQAVSDLIHQPLPALDAEIVK